MLGCDEDQPLDRGFPCGRRRQIPLHPKILSPPWRGMVAESPICRYQRPLNERPVKREARLYPALGASFRILL
jgi:hypothetical protein